MDPPTLNVQNELNTRLISLVDWIGSVSKEVESGVREQAPQLAREILAWGLAERITYIVIGAVLSLILLYIYKRLTDYHKEGVRLEQLYMAWARLPYSDQQGKAVPVKPGDSYEVAFVGRWFALIPSIIIFVAFTTCNVMDIVKIQTAPRLYLVETAAHWLHQ